MVVPVNDLSMIVIFNFPIISVTSNKFSKKWYSYPDSASRPFTSYQEDFNLWFLLQKSSLATTIGIITLILLKAWLMSNRAHKRTLVFLTPKSVLFILYLLPNCIKLQNKVRVIALSFIEWRLSRIYYLDKLCDMISDSCITCKILLT